MAHVSNLAPVTGDERAGASRGDPLMKALLIDRHSFFFARFASALHVYDANVSFVSVETSRSACDVLAMGHAFDLVLLNLQPDDGNGFEVLAELRNAYPALPILVASSVESNTEIVRSIYLGATGFVPKAAGAELLLEAVQAITAGRIFMPPMFAPVASAHADAVPTVRPDAAPALPRFAPPNLTRRQNEVLDLLMEGQTNKAMARQLNLSVDTVKDHVAAVLRTLKVRSRTQAVLAAGRLPRSATATDRHGRLLGQGEPIGVTPY